MAINTGINAKDRAALSQGLSKVLADDAQEAVVRTARGVLPIAEEANHQPALDVLTQRMDVHEKNAWMLRSLLKK